MSVTQETRRESYYESRVAAPTMRRIIYGALKKNGASTSDELMEMLGLSDPNSVRPRLTELRQDGLIEATGKKPSKRTGRSLAVYEVVEVETDVQFTD